LRCNQKIKAKRKIAANLILDKLEKGTKKEVLRYAPSLILLSSLLQKEIIQFFDNYETVAKYLSQHNIDTFVL